VTGGHWKDAKWELGTIDANSDKSVDLGRCTVPAGAKKEAKIEFVLVVSNLDKCQPVSFTKQLEITQ
jgi:hypothetical protein